jgi:hypothetical protein
MRPTAETRRESVRGAPPLWEGSAVARARREPAPFRSRVPSAEWPGVRQAAFVVALVVGGLLLILPTLLGCRSTATADDCPDSHLAAEDGLKPDAVRALRCVYQQFPEIKTFYGKRKDPLPDHPSGRAVDIMIDSAVPDYRSSAGVDLGNRVVRYLQDHKEDLRIDYLIWRQRSWKANRADDDWHPMKDRGSDNANHFNHVHVTTLGVGDRPTGGDPTRLEKPPPSGGATATSSTSASSSSTAGVPPQILDAHVVGAGTDTQLTQVCLTDQFQVVAAVSSSAVVTGLTLSMSGTQSSGPAPMEALAGHTYRSATIGIDTPGTFLFTIDAIDESGASTTTQASLSFPATGECGQVEKFTGT